MSQGSPGISWGIQYPHPDSFQVYLFSIIGFIIRALSFFPFFFFPSFHYLLLSIMHPSIHLSVCTSIQPTQSTSRLTSQPTNITNMCWTLHIDKALFMASSSIFTKKDLKDLSFQKPQRVNLKYNFFLIKLSPDKYFGKIFFIFYVILFIRVKDNTVLRGRGVSCVLL